MCIAVPNFPIRINSVYFLKDCFVFIRWREYVFELFGKDMDKRNIFFEDFMFRVPQRHVPYIFNYTYPVSIWSPKSAY